MMIFGSEPWNWLDGWLKFPQPSDTNRTVAVAFGIAVTLMLNFFRTHVGWFPFHHRLRGIE